MKSLKQLTADNIIKNHAAFFKQELAKNTLQYQAFIMQLIEENKTKWVSATPSGGRS